MFIKEYKNSNPEYIMPDLSEYLSNLKKINIFVGANNSGKSRFLRSIFQSGIDDLVFFKESKKLHESLERILKELQDRFGSKFYMNDLNALIHSSRCGDYRSRFNEFYNTINEKRQHVNNSDGIWDEQVARAIEMKMRDYQIFDKLDTEYDIDNQYIYVPMLRGLRHIDIEKENGKQLDLYKIRTEKDYKLLIKDKKDVFSGLNIYGEIKRMLLGSRKDREMIGDFEKFLSEAFFNNRKVTLISDFETDNIKINIDNNDEDREIFNVGDGIQSIIIATFQAFKYKNNNLILFLEEPELTMHPSTQRILIETLINKFPNLQIFLTTHSNHFLDLTYDYPEHVSIFSFEEKEKEKFYINDLGYNTKILDLLGIRNSSVFLSNCVIWTEGVTDRMLLKKLLSLKPDFQYNEDYHYAFAEYGGGNLENFDFINEENIEEKVNVKTISKSNFIIADNDDMLKPGNPKYERRQKIRSFLGNKNFFDSHIEIENLIPYQIWVKVIDKILKDKPDKRIKFKDNFETKEEKFNIELSKNKIGKIFRKYLIDKVDTAESLSYFNCDSIQCLGLSKKEIMKYVVDVIDEIKIELNSFPVKTQKLIRSIQKFIESANK